MFPLIQSLMGIRIGCTRIPIKDCEYNGATSQEKRTLDGFLMLVVSGVRPPAFRDKGLLTEVFWVEVWPPVYR